LGEHFDQLESFDAEGFISRLLGLGDIKKLMSVLKDSISDEEQLKTYQKLKDGQFTLGDMRTQYNTVTKMGSLNSIMSMIPGLSQTM